MNKSIPWWSFRILVAGTITSVLEISFFHNLGLMGILMMCGGILGLIIAKHRASQELKIFLPELLTKKTPKPDPKRRCYCEVCNNCCQMADMTLYPMWIGVVFLVLGFMIGIVPFFIFGISCWFGFAIGMAITNWYAEKTYSDCPLTRRSTSSQVSLIP